MNEPLITVIVPVYKAETYISDCISSILCQSYKNLELILIDDGSPDRSGFICDELSKTDTRIRVIHQKNSGVSSARNAGILASKGDYIVFVDSDDMVEPDALTYFVDVVKKHPNVDVIKGSHSAILPDGQIVETKFATNRRQLTDKILSGEEFWNKIVSQQKNVLVAMFRAELLRSSKILFNEKMRVMEDHMFMMELCNIMNTGIYIDRFCYKVRLENNCSITHNLSLGAINNMIDSAEYVKYYKSQKIKPFIKNGLLEDCALRLYYSIIHASHLKSYKDIINVSRRVKKLTVGKDTIKRFLKEYLSYYVEFRHSS